MKQTWTWKTWTSWRARS